MCDVVCVKISGAQATDKHSFAVRMHRPGLRCSAVDKEWSCEPCSKWYLFDAGDSPVPNHSVSSARSAETQGLFPW